MAYCPDAGDQQPPALKRRRNNPPTQTTGPIPQHTTRAFHQRGRVRLDEQVAFANQTLSFLPCHPGVNPPAGSDDNGVFVGSLSQLTAANNTLANVPFPYAPPHPLAVETDFLMHYSGPTDRLNFQYAAPQPPFTEGPFPSSTEESHQPLPAPVDSWPVEDSAPIDGIFFPPTQYQPTQFAPALPWPSLYPQFSGLPGSQPPLVSEHPGYLGIGTDASPTLYHSDACCSTAEPLSSQPGTFKSSGTLCLPSPPESNPSYHRDIQSPFSLHNEPQERQDFQVGQISNADAVAGIGQRFYGPETPLYTTSERSESSEQSIGAAIGLTFPFPPECHYVGTEENSEPSVSDSLGTEKEEIPGESHNACSGSSKGKKPAIKTCVRCRFQKQKCILDPTDPDGPCIPCQSISRTSKKTIHRTPCFHNKITDNVLFRSGGLGLTRRWTGTEMKNIVTPLQARKPRTIEFTQSAEQKPIVINVVPFEPIEGDITSRFWTVIENGVVVQKSKEIKPFCLANIRRTAIYFEQYIKENAIPDFRCRGAPGSRANAPMSSYDPIQATYHMAVELYESIPDEVAAYEGGALVANREKRLLGNLFTLSFAIRQTTGSAYICGEDTLDMAPETDDPSYPLQGKVSLPRMLLAQFDSINHTKLLVPLRMKVLRELEYLIVQNKKRYWFTIYVCLFILLREASWITEDRSRHAKAVHQAKIRYSIPRFVESLQEGCNTLLMFWHYYNCRPMPASADAAAHYTSFLSELTVEQYNLVMWTMTNSGVQEQLSMWRTYRTENGFIPEPEQPHDGETAYTGNQRKLPWDHPYYWIAQLFEEDWTPHPTYKREYI